ncbi:anaerobic ribonucleoside-triphosphate reductase [Streptomyces sp. NBC_00872]|nr:anaerobic ribonucleoside-triphosphate reductase [Streptomyces sp. NBC_00872]
MTEEAPAWGQPPGPEEESVCRVCGFDDEIFWERGWPTAAVCPCCGNESDISDVIVSSIREYRGYWLGGGAKWHIRHERPANWDLLLQISNISQEWR